MEVGTVVDVVGRVEILVVKEVDIWVSTAVDVVGGVEI
jgi:hypothetical protein